MTAHTIPVHADDNYRQYINRIEELKTANIGKVIPKELFKKNVWRSLSGFLASYALYLGSIVGIAFAPHWSIVVLLLITAGLGGWGLHCIAHDCGHGSFSNSKTLNSIIAHSFVISFPFLAPCAQHAPRLHQPSGNGYRLASGFTGSVQPPAV